jgi:hypothetical protein
MNAAYETYSCRDHFQQTDVPVISQVLGSLNEPDVHRWSFPARTGFYVRSLGVALVIAGCGVKLCKPNYLRLRIPGME